MKNECSFVKDILPLYYEGMVSEETAEFVKEHLETCEECRKRLDEMKSGSEIDSIQSKTDENQAEPIKKFKRKQRKKKVLIVCAAVLLTAVVLLITPQILPASISYGESELYTREEQKEAVDFILDSFKEWKGCKLYSYTTPAMISARENWNTATLWHRTAWNIQNVLCIAPNFAHHSIIQR